MNQKLKHGTTASPRLDRIPEFDERSRNYPIRTLVEGRKPRSYTWRCSLYLDQMQEGACVGCGITHELAARPSEVQGLDMRFAREKIYWEAQKLDPWPGGSYPKASPKYEGTSVLAGIKAAQKLGYFESYRWAFSVEDILLGLSYHGPCVLGLNWYEGMFDPDKEGTIHPTGRLLGGHCLLAYRIDIKNQRVLLRNSWGRSWGMNGDCWLRWRDLANLMRLKGEAVFVLKRKTKVK